MRCKRCGKSQTDENSAYSCGFAGYCLDCELDMCHEEGLSDSVVPIFLDKKNYPIEI